MLIDVTFRGQALQLDVDGPDTTIGELKAQLEAATNVPVSFQRLISKGKTLADEARVGDAKKLMLLGNKSEDVAAAVQRPEQTVRVKDDLDGSDVPKGYKKVPLASLARAEPESPYRFQRIEVLPALPDQERARSILTELANDPGIRRVLELHKWTVGALCEMMPEGQVGISDVCVMGLNENRGQRILLRLRTDDLQGFRKALSIRKVLYHELAHNVYSEHDNNFYQLMRVVEREATELNWTMQRGRTASSSRGVHRETAAGDQGDGGYVLVKEAFEGGGGRLGGDSEALTSIFSARELAAQAAVERLSAEEKEIEEACGCGGASKGAHKHQQEKPGSSSSRSLPPPQQQTGRSGTTELRRRSASPPALSNAVFVGAGEPVALESEEEARQEVQAAATGAVTPANAPSEHEMEVEAAKDAAGGAEADAASAGPANAEEAMEVESEQLLPPPPPTPLQEIVAMGFPLEAAEGALERANGSVSRAIEMLLLPETAEEAVVAPDGGSDNSSTLPRQDRIERAAAAIAADADTARAAWAFETILSIIRAILANPEEQRIRRVRLANKRFATAVGYRPEGRGLLEAAGFEERDGELVLSRNDVGLLWLAAAVVEKQLQAVRSAR